MYPLSCELTHWHLVITWDLDKFLICILKTYLQREEENKSISLVDKNYNKWKQIFFNSYLHLTRFNSITWNYSFYKNTLNIIVHKLIFNLWLNLYYFFTIYCRVNEPLHTQFIHSFWYLRGSHKYFIASAIVKTAFKFN